MTHYFVTQICSLCCHGNRDLRQMKPKLLSQFSDFRQFFDKNEYVPGSKIEKKIAVTVLHFFKFLLEIAFFEQKWPKKLAKTPFRVSAATYIFI